MSNLGSIEHERFPPRLQYANLESTHTSRHGVPVFISGCPLGLGMRGVRTARPLGFRAPVWALERGKGCTQASAQGALPHSLSFRIPPAFEPSWLIGGGRPQVSCAGTTLSILFILWVRTLWALWAPWAGESAAEQ